MITPVMQSQSWQRAQLKKKMELPKSVCQPEAALVDLSRAREPDYTGHSGAEEIRTLSF